MARLRQWKAQTRLEISLVPIISVPKKETSTTIYVLTGSSFVVKEGGAVALTFKDYGHL